MNVTIPARVQTQFQAFRNAGSFGAGAQREELDKTVIGGAGFVLGLQAQYLTASDEMEGVDAAIGKPGYIEFTREAVHDLAEVFPGAAEIKSSFDSKATLKNQIINAEFHTIDGGITFNQMSTSPQALSTATATATADGYILEGMYLSDADGKGWTEKFLVPR